MDQISALVRSAVGFDQGRGDTVEVVNLRFAEAPASLPLDSAKTGFAALFDFSKDDIIRFSEMGVLLLMTLLVLLIAVRPLIKKITSDNAARDTGAATSGNGMFAGLPNFTAIQSSQAALLNGQHGTAVAAVGPDGQPVAAGDGATPGPDGENGLADATHSGPNRLEIAQKLGALQATSIAQVGEMIKENPGEASSIVRNWLMDG
jgi:flagellar M-ring protein FliF